MTIPQWEHFEHQADIGVRGSGTTQAQAFEQAALAMYAIVSDLSSIEPKQVINVTCRDTDHELLLVDWLNALIFETATRKMLFSRFAVNIEDGQLTATVWGESINIARHHPAVEIKGATYTELKVYQKQGQWIAQCIVDV
jgi:SHS2 domain-containing protein